MWLNPFSYQHFEQVDLHNYLGKQKWQALLTNIKRVVSRFGMAQNEFSIRLGTFIPKMLAIKVGIIRMI